MVKLVLLLQSSYCTSCREIRTNDLACHIYVKRPSKLDLGAYADSVASDEPAHLRTLIREIDCRLFCRKGSRWPTNGQCSSQISLRECSGVSETSLSAHVRRCIFAWRNTNGTWYIYRRRYHVSLTACAFTLSCLREKTFIQREKDPLESKKTLHIIRCKMIYWI